MKSNNPISFKEMQEKIDAGLTLSYQRLVEKKAKEGGTLIYMVDGKITEVPAIQLLEELKKAS